MNDSKMTPPPGDEPMSVRECRLILERLLVVAGTDPGLLPASRDALLDAQVLGVPVLEAIHSDPDLLTGQRPSITRAGASWHVEGHGQFSLLLLPDLVDLVVADTRRRGAAELTVHDVRQPEHLRVLAPLLAGAGVAVQVAPGASETRVSGGPTTADPSATEQARRTALAAGFRVAGEVWLDLYQRSNGALVPESPGTMRHAGHSDVDEHGNFIRQMDDDADVEQALRQRAVGSR